MTEILQIDPQDPDPLQKRMTAISDTFGQDFGLAVAAGFRDHGVQQAMLFNENFQYLLGGPVWNQGAKGTKAYFRKYIGLDGSKDFTIVTALPIESLLRYPVVYSHGPASDWASGTSLPLGERFASVRSPLGTINSACFSINALASSYITRHQPHAEVEEIRYALASYKLSSRRFFGALVRPYVTGLQDLLEVRDHFNILHWEDIITAPQKVVRRLSEILKISISETEAEQIWSKIAYRNLTGAHRHNFRVGKAFVGDEQSTVVNEHIDFLRESGAFSLAQELGYPMPRYLDEREYTPFQKRIAKAWNEDIELNDCEDSSLFEYAFNKSNLDFSEFGYRTHPWLEHCQVERSGLPDEALEVTVSSYVEQSLNRLSALVTYVAESAEMPWSQREFESRVKELDWPDSLPVEEWLEAVCIRV